MYNVGSLYKKHQNYKLSTINYKLFDQNYLLKEELQRYMYAIGPLRSVIDAIRIQYYPEARLVDAMQIAVVTRRILIQICGLRSERDDLECKIADIHPIGISELDSGS